MADVSPYRDNDPANRLGLDYAAEAMRLPWPGRIIDAHIHIHGRRAAQCLAHVASLFQIDRFWSQSHLEELDEVRDELQGRVEFVAIPNYAAKDDPATFTTDWLRRIEAFADKGARLCKFWAAPRGVDFHPALKLDSPIRRQGMDLARQAGMMFMTHVADPDTWFATHYRDSARYGLKADHYRPLERLLEEYRDVPWLAAHLAGHPEDLGHLQDLLDAHPNLYLDTSAAKWMIRELSRRPAEFRAFCQRNPGRVLFGSDIVASDTLYGFNLYASRYWSLRTLLETDYTGLSPIVDPDLHAIDPATPADATPPLRGCRMDAATLQSLYYNAATDLIAQARALPVRR